MCYLSEVCKLCSNMSISACNYSWHATRVGLLITGTNTRVMWGFFQLHAALGKRIGQRPQVSRDLCFRCGTFKTPSRCFDVIRWLVCATPCRRENVVADLSLLKSDLFKSQACLNQHLVTSDFWRKFSVFKLFKELN